MQPIMDFLMDNLWLQNSQILYQLRPVIGSITSFAISWDGFIIYLHIDNNNNKKLDLTSI